VSDEKAGSCANGGGENRNVFRVREFPRAFTVVRCGTVNLEWDGAEEFPEERRGLRELGGQVPADLGHGSLWEHQTKEAKLGEDQNRVAGAGAGHEARDQDVSIDTDA
jgi:hypothetical protein